MKKIMSTIKYGSETIPYSLIFSERKHLTINVHPDLNVEVNAPLGASEDKVYSKIIKRASWILKQRRHFKKISSPSTVKNFVSGESFYYLGKQYRLKIIKSSEEKALLKNGKLFICTKQPESKSIISNLITEWYLSKAKERFSSRITVLLPKLKKYSIEEPKLELKKMKKRWGSCTAKGKIILNPALITAPSECIDYVIMHELCHLVVHNHSKKYWNLLTKILPMWEHHKSKLESVDYLELQR